MEEKLKLLYEQAGADFDLGTFEEFSSKMQEPSKRRAFFDAASQKYDLGDFDSFSQKVTIEKKNLSGNESSLSSPISAPVAERNFRDQSIPLDESRDRPVQKENLIRPGRIEGRRTVGDPQVSTISVNIDEDIDSQVSSALKDGMARQSKEDSLGRLRDRENFDVDAIDANPEQFERIAESAPTWGEIAYRRGNRKKIQESVGDLEQGTIKEYTAKMSALGNENERIAKSIEVLEEQAAEQIGAPYLSLDDNMFRLENLKKQIDGAEGADRNTLIERYDEIRQEVNNVLEHPIIQEISKYSNLYEKNISRFKSENENDRYRVAKRHLQALEERQKEVDESYRTDGWIRDALGAGRDIGLKTIAGFAGGLADLTDMAEKSIGDDDQGVGDHIQDFFSGIAADAERSFPAPTNLSRGIRTTTAKYDRDGELLQIDFDKDGEIAAIRDEEGFIVKNDLTPSELEKVKELPTEKSWNYKGIPYQAGETIADLGAQIVGAKGLGALGRGGRYASALENTGFIATSAGMMSGDLYEEGIKAGLSEEDAARYSLAVGVSIGASNLLLGLGAESQLLNKGIVSKVASPNFGKGLKGAIAEKSFNVLKSASGETLEEVGIEKLQEMGIQYLFNEMGGGQFKMDQFEDSDQLVSEAAIAFIVGGLASGGGNRMSKEQMNTAADNIDAVVEQVGEIAGPERATEVKAELEAISRAKSSVPQEQKTDVDTIDKVVEKQKVEEEISELKKEKSELDSAFHGPVDEKLERAEQRRDEIEQSIREQRPVPTFISGEFEVNEDTFEVTSRLGNEVTPYQKKKVMDEYKEARVDKIATQGEIKDLSGIPDEEVAASLVESDTPVQIAESWMAEPETVVPTDPNIAIQDFMSKNSFTEDLIGQFVGNRTKSEKRTVKAYTKAGKPVQGDLGLFMDELNAHLDSLGLPRASEDDVRSAIENNPSNKKVEFKEEKNRTKKALSDRFTEITGVKLDEEYANRISERSAKLREEAKIMESAPKGEERPIGKEGKGEKVRRGTQVGILERGKNLDEAKGAIKKLSDRTPDYYNRLNLKEYGQQISEEIERDGGPMSAETLNSIAPENIKSPVRAQAKRVVVLQMLGDRIAQAWKDGDIYEADVLSSTIDRIERDMAEAATEAGQQSAVLALWYSTPEGRIAQLVSKVRKARNSQLEVMTSTGEPVGAVIEGIVKEVAQQLKIPASEVKAALGSKGQKKGSVKAREKRKEAAKEVEDAFRAIGRNIRSKAGSAPSVDIELLVNAFKAVRKLFSASIEEAKAEFIKRLDEMGLNGKNELSRLESERPSLFDSEQEGVLVNEVLQGAEIDKVELRKRVEQIVRNHVKGKKVKQISDSLTEAIVLGGLEEDVLRKAVEEKFGIPEITKEDVATITKMVNGAKEMPEGVLRNERFQRVMDFITSEFTGEDIVDVNLAMWHSFILSSPKTWFSVLWGNIGTSIGLLYRLPTTGGKFGARAMFNSMPFIWKEMGNIMRTGTSYKSMDKIIKSSTIERIAKRQLKGTGKTGLWLLDAFFGQAYGMNSQDRFTMLARGAKVGKKRVGFKDVSRIMNALDAISYYANSSFLMGRDAYRIALSEGLKGKAAKERANEIIAGSKAAREAFIEQAKRELDGKDVNEYEILYRAKEIGETKLRALSPGSVEKAEAHGRRMSLQGPARGFWGAIAKKIGGLADIIDISDPELTKLEKATGQFLTFYIRTLTPFLNTAAHMTNLAMDYVPVGGIVQKGLDALPLRGVDKGEFWESSEERRIFALKQMLGMGLFFGLLGMATDDEDDSFDITANGPKSFSKKSDFYSHGMKPYSMRIGDTVINYRDWPIAGALAMLGGMADKAKYNDPEMEDGAFVHLYGALMGYFSNASMLQTFGDISKAAGEKDPSRLAYIASRPILGFTNPGIIRHVERLFDPELRDKKSSPYGKLAGNIAANVPLGGFMDLGYKYNSLGEKIDPGKNMSFLWKGLGFDKYISSGKPYNEVFSIMADKGVFFPAIGEGTKLAGTKMTYQEYRAYALAVGRARKKLLPPIAELERMSKEEIEVMLSARKKGSVENIARNIAEIIVLKNRENITSMDIEKTDKELRSIVGG